MKKIKLLFPVILFLTFAACDEAQKVINTAGNVQLNGNYTIHQVGDKSYTSKGLVITFDGLNKSFSSKTECNSLFGSYSLDLFVIKFGPIASTKMYCEGKMEAEKEIADQLEATGSYTIENGVLKLYSSTDRSLLFTATKVKETHEN